MIEVKSFTDLAALEEAKIQAAGYAKKLNLGAIALVVFAPVEDEDWRNNPAVCDVSQKTEYRTSNGKVCLMPDETGSSQAE